MGVYLPVTLMISSSSTRRMLPDSVKIIAYNCSVEMDSSIQSSRILKDVPTLNY